MGWCGYEYSRRGCEVNLLPPPSHPLLLQQPKANNRTTLTILAASPLHCGTARRCMHHPVVCIAYLVLSSPSLFTAIFFWMYIPTLLCFVIQSPSELFPHISEVSNDAVQTKPPDYGRGHNGWSGEYSRGVGGVTRRGGGGRRLKTSQGE